MSAGGASGGAGGGSALSQRAIVFCIARKGSPLYEARLKAGKEDGGHFSQFVLHAALDMVEEARWTSTSTYLKVVDRYNEQPVSAYVTQGGAVMLLMHDGRADDVVRHFFQEVHELFVKVALNPFQAEQGPVTSSTFDERVRALASKHLGL